MKVSLMIFRRELNTFYQVCVRATVAVPTVVWIFSDGDVGLYVKEFSWSLDALICFTLTRAQLTVSHLTLVLVKLVCCSFLLWYIVSWINWEWVHRWMAMLSGVLLVYSSLVMVVLIGILCRCKIFCFFNQGSCISYSNAILSPTPWTPLTAAFLVMVQIRGANEGFYLPQMHSFWTLHPGVFICF